MYTIIEYNIARGRSAVSTSKRDVRMNVIFACLQAETHNERNRPVLVMRRRQKKYKTARTRRHSAVP